MTKALNGPVVSEREDWNIKILQTMDRQMPRMDKVHTAFWPGKLKTKQSDIFEFEIENHKLHKIPGAYRGLSN